jgi:uncharacterized protein with NRDE domain
MCTLTFQPEGIPEGARWILFNRDELRSRPRALPPQRFTGEAGDYLMPVDPQGGGSWMGLHEKGFFVCLLNYYPGDLIIRDPALRSRGLLIRDILEAGELPGRADLAAALRRHEYAPFYLAAFSRRTTGLWSWDTRTLDDLPADPRILSSSGYEHTRISAVRRWEFLNREQDSGLQTREDLLDFHLSGNAHDGAEGILMTRPDAMTVSISRIGLFADHGVMEYRERSNLDRPMEHTIEF